MDGSRSIVLSRRGFFTVFGSTTVVGTSGCLGNNTSVSVLAAGSLAQTFEEHIGPAFQAATDIEVHGEYFGTNAIMRMVEDQTKHPDVIVSADATLLRDRLYGAFTDWDVEFATNSLGIGYNEQTEFGQRLADGDRWYAVVRDMHDGDLTIGDPNLDPLGYRAVQAFELAEQSYDLDGFRDDVLDIAYEEPDESQIVAGVESGARAAAIVYQNMAVDHGVPFQEFPDAYNFANPELAEHYSTVEFVTDEEEYRAVGRPIIYNATVTEATEDPEASVELIQFLIDHPELLVEAGLTVADELPRPTGNVPDGVTL